VLTTQGIFDRYEQVRARLPCMADAPVTRDIASLLEIAAHVDAFVFDAFGVLNVGETLIPGADTRLDQLRAQGKDISILTNAASFDRPHTLAKFARLGLGLRDGEVIASRTAALAQVTPMHWGVIAASTDTLEDMPQPFTRMADDTQAYDRADGFLFLSAADWTDECQSILTASMDSNPRPLLIGNADLAAPREDGFSREPGYFGHLIADRHSNVVQFFGKPYADVYDRIEATLPGIRPARIVMCGDTLHTDILGAAARGWRTVLVTQDGLFAGHDTRVFCDASGIQADWRTARI